MTLSPYVVLLLDLLHNCLDPLVEGKYSTYPCCYGKEYMVHQFALWLARKQMCSCIWTQSSFLNLLTYESRKDSLPSLTIKKTKHQCLNITVQNFYMEESKHQIFYIEKMQRFQSMSVNSSTSILPSPYLSIQGLVDYKSRAFSLHLLSQPDWG